MKRNPNQITVKKIYPLIFWQDCAICKMQFRREFGFQTSSTVKGHLARPFEIQREYCGECAPDKTAAENIFKECLRDWPNLPKPPSKD